MAADDRATELIITGRELCWLIFAAFVAGFIIARWIP